MLRQKLFLLAFLGAMTAGYIAVKTNVSGNSSATVALLPSAKMTLADEGVKFETTPRTDGKDSAQVIVRCEKADGTGVERVTVFFTQPDTTSLLNMRTDAKGDADAVDVAPGRYALSDVKEDILGEAVEAVAKRLFPLDCEFKAGQTTKVTILVKHRDLPKLVVDVRLKADGRPLPAKRVIEFRVYALGASVDLKEVRPGEFHGEYEFRFSTATGFEQPAQFMLKGRGFEDVDWTVPIPSKDKVVHLSIERDLPLLPDTAQGRVIDGDTERPIGNVSFRLHVRQSPTSISFVPITVHARDDGSFELPHVRFPCDLFVNETKGGERWTPELGAAVRLERASDIAWIRRYRARGVTAQFSKRVIEAIGSVESPEVWVDCLPLTPIRERRQLEIGLSKRLDSPTIASVKSTGKLAIGYLPNGRYRITIVVANLGTYAREFEKKGTAAESTFEVDIETSDASIEIDPAPWAPEGGCVIDGYVPSTLAVVIRDDLLRRPVVPSAQRRAYAAFLTGEKVTLPSRNKESRVVTVVTRDDCVFHTRPTASTQKASDPATQRVPRDVVVTGRVVDRNGRPIVGAVVNLTSLWGGEREDKVLVPTTVEMRAIRTDDGGQFRIEGVTPAAYVLSVADLIVTKDGTDREFRYAPSSLRIVELLASNPDIEEIKLEEEGVACSCGLLHLSDGFRH